MIKPRITLTSQAVTFTRTLPFSCWESRLEKELHSFHTCEWLNGFTGDAKQLKKQRKRLSNLILSYTTGVKRNIVPNTWREREESPHACQNVKFCPPKKPVNLLKQKTRQVGCVWLIHWNVFSCCCQRAHDVVAWITSFISIKGRHEHEKGGPRVFKGLTRFIVFVDHVDLKAVSRTAWSRRLCMSIHLLPCSKKQ